MTVERISPALPVGVQLRSLETHVDDRGEFTELFRQQWPTEVDPVQWNFVRSFEGVLRGVHVHVMHDDYLILVAGRATVGLRDFRTGSETNGLAYTVDLDAERLQAIVIPHGVAHGFLFVTDAAHVYAVSRYWDPDDELACRWDDPDLGIDWPLRPTLVSDRDRQALPVSELIQQLERWQPI